MDRQTFSPDVEGGPGKDYILRMIEDFGVFLGKLTARIMNREYSEAAKQIESYYREILGLNAGLIHTFSDRTLIGLLLKNGEMDALKCLNLAKVLQVDAELASRSGAGQAEVAPIARVKYLLAFSLLMEVALGGGQSLPAGAEADLDSLAANIAGWELPDTLAYKLHRYFVYKGQYGKAEDALFRLKDSGFPEANREGWKFYQQMSALGDAELQQGNLPRAELEEGKRHFFDPELT